MGMCSFGILDSHITVKFNEGPQLMHLKTTPYHVVAQLNLKDTIYR